MAQRREDMRAADADRQFVADRLREALNEGRLELGEYDDRLQKTYAARTYGELDQLLGDLPGVARPEHSQVVPAPSTAPGTRQPAQAPIGPWLKAVWGTWFTVSAVCFVIWALTGAGGFPPWPVWVAGPWAVVLLGTTVSGPGSRYPRRRVDRLQERWERRQERWNRRRYR